MARGGRVVELRGDEALAVFSSARQAVAAAVDLQERLVDETIDDPELPMPVGIGLDAGEAVPLEEGYRGGALNLAARLCGQAGPGEILASRSVTHLARRVEGVRYVDRGKVQLKNLTDPVEWCGSFQRVSIRPSGCGRHCRRPAGASRSRARIADRGSGRPRHRGRRHDRPAPRRCRADDRGGSGRAPQPLGGPRRHRGASVSSRGDSLREPDRSGWPTARADRLIQVDPSTFQVEERIPVGVGPTGVAIAYGLVWVANTDERTVSMVDPQAHQVVQTVVVGNGPAGIVADGDRVWVANSVDATVTEIDATDGSVVDTYPVGERPVALAVADGAVWVANASDGTVSRVVSGDGETQTITVGRGPAAIASAFGSLWVANAEDGTVTTIDPATGSATTERVGEGADRARVRRRRHLGRERWRRHRPQDRPGDHAGHRHLRRWERTPGPDGDRGRTLGRRRGVARRASGRDASARDEAADGDRSPRRRRRLRHGARIDVRRPRDVSASQRCRRSDGRAGSGRVASRADRRRPHVHVHAPRRDPFLGRPRPHAAGRRGDLRAGPGREASTTGTTCPSSSAGPRAHREDPEACDLSEGVVADEEAGTVTFHLVRPAPDFLKILATPHSRSCPPARRSIWRANRSRRPVPT